MRHGAGSTRCSALPFSWWRCRDARKPRDRARRAVDAVRWRSRGRPRGLSPDAGVLQALDLEAERARRAATSAGEQARELRARLGGVLDTLPAIADLEDERDACETARDRGLRQLNALRCAAELIEAASRVTHRELAPRLAESLAAASAC